MKGLRPLKHRQEILSFLSFYSFFEERGGEQCKAEGEERGGRGSWKGEMWKRELRKGVSGEIAGEIVMSMG